MTPDSTFSGNFSTQNAVFEVGGASASQQFDGNVGAMMNIGTTDYPELSNKPSINSVTLVGDKTSNDLGLQDSMSYITEQQIDRILFGGGDAR